MFSQLTQYIPKEFSAYLLPLFYIIGSVLVGLFFEKVVLVLLRKVTAKMRWKGDDAILNAMKGMLFLWSFCAGLYFAAMYAVRDIPLNTSLFTLASQILGLVIIASITVIAARSAVGFIHLYAGKIRGVFASTSIFSNITKGLIFFIGVLIGLQTIGISITPILAALGVGGLAVALALQDSLSNLFSGLHIIASRQFKQGDFVKVDNSEQGYIHDISWRNTTIKSLSNNMIIIPNIKMASAVIVNYSQPHEELSVVVEVTLSYDNDLKHVEKVTLEVAENAIKTTPGSIPGFKPFVRFNLFNDTNIKMNVILRGKEYVNQYLIKHEFLKKLHERYKQEGINITNPSKPTLLLKESKTE